MEDRIYTHPSTLAEQKEKRETAELLLLNEQTSQYGLTLTEEEARELAGIRNESLKKYRRIELGRGILDKLIDTFCDSQYIDQDHYLEILSVLQDIFYRFKNESQDRVTDDELLQFMKEQFEDVCMGDTDYLADTCLSRFAKAVRSGYEGYQRSEGRGEYERFSEEQRWDKDLYFQALRDLGWGQEMEYQAEELLELTERLSRSYTSFESTSIPYETAQMLMGAVLYCIDECGGKTGGAGVVSQDILPAGQAYEAGFELVKDKVCRTKQIYEELIQNFEDYGCKNYRDTVLKGLPKFFLYYDPKFQPQNHILTLDYPALEPLQDVCGIDKIYRYVSDLLTEKRLLDCFDPAVICRCLDDGFPDYRELYMDNISSFILFRAVTCMIADRPVMRLMVKTEDQKLIKDFFAGDTFDKVAVKVKSIIGMLEERLTGQRTDYFTQISRDHAVMLLKSRYRN